MAIFEKNLSVHKYSKLVLDVSRVSQNVAGNYTTISYKLYLQAFSGGYPWGRNGGYAYNVKVDGTTISSGTLPEYKVPKNGTFLITQGTRNVAHGADGKKTIALSGFFQAESIHGNATATGSMALPDIPRASNITSFTVGSTTPTQFNFAYKVDKPVSEVQYNLNGSGWTTPPISNIIKGLAPSTTNTIQIKVKNTASGVWSVSNIISVRTLALSVMANVIDFNIDSPLTVGITRSNLQMHHDVTLEVWNDDQTFHQVKTLNNQQESAVFNLTEDEKTIIYDGRKASNTTTARVKIVSRWGSGGEVQGETYKSGSLLIVNANPTLSGLTYQDTNATVQSVLADNQLILRNKSNLKVTVGTANSVRGAFLSNYRVILDGKTYKFDTDNTLKTETGKVLDMGVVNITGDTVATLILTDTRGNTISKTFSVKGLDYSPPALTKVVAKRVSDYGEETHLDTTGERSVVKKTDIDLNNFQIRYRVKEGAGVFGSYQTIVESNGALSGTRQKFSLLKVLGNYPTDKTYTVEISIKDSFNDWIVYNTNITEGVPIVKIMQDKVEVSVSVLDSESKQPYIFFSSYDEW